MTLGAAIRAQAAAWAEQDPDPATRAELESLLAAAGRDEAAAAEVEDRFAGRLRFGTAGLRGAVGAGPNRMNRAVVRTASAAVLRWLDARDEWARTDGVVVGCDARHGSADFAGEVAQVFAAGGFRVHLLEPRRPTPLLAFAVRHLGAAAGVMITASHNPKADNGYKLYLRDGAQIVPPVDEEIEALMDGLGPLPQVPAHGGEELVVRHGPIVEAAFVDAVAAESPAPVGAGALSIVYTPLHGVARGTFEAALVAAGYPPPSVVAPQAEPDPDFPTLVFPNPEEPGTLDLALDEARASGADVLVASDPDGDRLAVAVPSPEATGGWRVLTGDQLGCLLGDHLLRRSASGDDPEGRLVATTIVSSTMLRKIAEAAGVRYAETLTGFKWIVRAGQRLARYRFVFGYEEALGYCVGTVVRDKDGIGAALAFLGLAAELSAAGSGVLDRWADLERRHGVHLTGQLSIRAGDPSATMGRLRQDPPRSLGGLAVASVRDLAAGGPGEHIALPRSDVLTYQLDGARVVVRPSGTEPKLKAYVEVVRPVAGDGLGAARGAAAERMSALRDDLAARLAR